MKRSAPIPFETQGKADLHIHSAVCDGMASVREILDYVEDATDLDVIAITDHDEIAGAFEASALARRRNSRVEVVVGMEVSTLGGHLLAYDIAEAVPGYRPLPDTIRMVHSQGGFCVVPHPASWLTTSIGERRLNSILDAEDLSVDGIEVWNPSIAGKVVHDKVLRLNRSSWHLPETGGSDAHTLELIGTGRTLFPGSTADDLRAALRTGGTMAAGEFWGWDEHRELSKIAVQQVFKSWVVVPARKVRKAVSSARRRGAG